ncbi:MAG: MFS transporter, partial [Chloroflexota bacterium]
STVLAPDEKTQVATVLEVDAQIMSDAQLNELLADQPTEVQAEIVRINADARHLSLQIALLIPLIAATLGFAVSILMRRQPDPVSSGGAEMVVGG